MVRPASCSSPALGTQNDDRPRGAHRHVWVLSIPVHLGSLFLDGADAGTLAHSNYQMLQNGVGGNGGRQEGAKRLGQARLGQGVPPECQSRGTLQGSAGLTPSSDPHAIWGFPGGSDSKESACNAEDPGLIPGSGRSPGGGHATHSSVLAWRTPRTEEPGGLQSMGLHRVRHDCTTNWGPEREQHAGSSRLPASYPACALS